MMSEMTEKELIELAAKAIGVREHGEWFASDDGPYFVVGSKLFDPLTDDGDALRLAVKLNIHVMVWVYACEAQYGDCESTGLIHASDCGGDVCAATRRAITRAAAQIGKDME